jgi:hypothetical protein
MNLDRLSSFRLQYVYMTLVGKLPETFCEATS